MEVSQKSQLIYDPIYGFIKLTPVEWKIIHTAFYQRLRWIKQLGTSFYVFPGAEHSRFGHSIGVLNNAHRILKSIGLAVSEAELLDDKCQTEEKNFHQSLRLGALMHDLGTFCFSHTTEAAYISFGETTNVKGGKKLKDDHENLGAYIIKNTNFEGGITSILEEYNIDPQYISDLVKGVDKSIIASQILHSEIDCDRMDYLLRDAHYTGLNYGTYDRDYLLHHFQMKKINEHRILTIKHNAIHCVEDFLMSRFAWYSQVIRSPRGSRYDAIVEKITFYMLEKGLIYRYSDLLEMISSDPMKFLHYNDNYFMATVNSSLANGEFDGDKEMKDMVLTFLLEKGTRTIRLPEFEHRLVEQGSTEAKKLMRKAYQKVEEIQALLSKKGKKEDWMIADFPRKDIIFIKSKANIIKDTKSENVLIERDPVKISYEGGNVRLLADVEDSIISRLHDQAHFTPNLFCSHSAYEILVAEGYIE
ncbi:MAG: HD domain-containing protein [Halobacteriovoraceae bacterium]|jgi:uncharacterized protein|nr:HD domain-containing protein [Halobacteriovoraceae bacterium]